MGGVIWTEMKHINDKKKKRKEEGKHKTRLQDNCKN